MDVAVGFPSPALDAREEAFDARAVTMDGVVQHRRRVLEAAAVRVKNWDEIFCPGENVDILLFGVPILG